MDVTLLNAMQGYTRARMDAAANPEAGGAASGFLGAIGSFSDVLANADQTARSAMMGDASPHALVEALAASSTAVETVVAVRDKVVEAYQEILRMPV